jgi:CRISPR-associated protein Csc1
MFVTICHLELHDYLFYASRELGRLYETEKYLHNYGLTYALGLAKAPYANLTQIPHYQEDLQVLNEQGVYVTPAYPLHYSFAFSTFKMANVNYYNITPPISSNQVIFGRAKELAPQSTFEFFVLSESEVDLPHWIRLGKWMTKAHIVVKSQEVARLKRGSYQSVGALNPLDLAQMPQNCNIVAMAPASLVTHAYCSGDYYDLSREDSKLGAIGLPVGMSYQPERNRRLLA